MIKLLKHAYAHVPLWRMLLDQAHLNLEKIQTLQDFSCVPLTSKQTYLGKTTEEFTDNSRPIGSRWYVTSGTSGVPFRFLQSNNALRDNYIDFASYRFLLWRGMSMSQLRTVKIARIKIRAPWSTYRCFIPVGRFLEEPEETMSILANFNPEIISAYPSILLEIAQYVAKNPTHDRPRPQFAVSFGEMLSPAVRRYVEDTLQLEIYDRYGLEEIGVIGLECASHDGFHVHTESVLVEIVDDQGNSVPPGIEGRIIATDLFNYGMPFIRYETGDRGTLSFEHCACGLRSPRLRIIGRYSAYLAFGGRRIHHLEFDGAMDELMHYVFQYQVAKKSDTEVIVRIIPGPAFHAGIIETIYRNIQKLVGNDIEIDVTQVTHFSPTNRAKNRIINDESDCGGRH